MMNHLQQKMMLPNLPKLIIPILNKILKITLQKTNPKQTKPLKLWLINKNMMKRSKKLRKNKQPRIKKRLKKPPRPKRLKRRKQLLKGEQRRRQLIEKLGKRNNRENRRLRRIPRQQKRRNKTDIHPRPGAE